MKETKDERFRRVAEARVNKLIKMIRLLGNCSNTLTYAFRKDQVSKIFDTLQTELDRAKKRFEVPEKKRFSLSQNQQPTVEDFPSIELSLPGGSKLKAISIDGESYPAINIYRVKSGSTEQELLCFVEFNPERCPSHEVCVGAYQLHQDDTTYYEPYMAERETNE